MHLYLALMSAAALASPAFAQHSQDPTTGAATDSALMAAGISRELADYRTARVRDVTYHLSLDLTSRDTARGHVTIGFRRAGNGDGILDFRGPHVWNVRVNGHEIAPANGAHIRLPAPLLRDGSNTVTADFKALIAPAGASVIRFHDVADSSDYMYTLLVPADANQLFPSFDQPDLKARTTLELTIPHGWSAVANGPLVRGDTTRSAVKLVFAETRPMSTYLIAFAAGPWSRVTRTVHGRQITMYVRASRAREAEADALIATNGRAVEWLANYFGVPYPWPKLDFVLAPAFPFGGMEHPGAIFYNENTFIFRERPTQPQLLAREATIYHEVAHQWFGDLVTMQWFDDLWLKEGFATYMAAKMQAALEPASNAWETFYLRNKPAAYAVDRTAGTTPVWQALGNLDQAKSNYGAIVYNKAPGILKQLNYLVGDSAFRAGLQSFLTMHAYANATWRDLLGAVGGAAQVSLDRWGDAYISRRGVPVIEQSVVTRMGALQSITLRQHPAVDTSDARPWPIRTEVLLRYPDGRSDRMRLDLDTDVTTAQLPPGATAPVFVYANAGDNAYAIVVPDSASARWLESNVGTLDDPLLRAMAWDALWELVRRRMLAPEHFIAIAQRDLPHDQDEQIVTAQLRHVVRATNAYLSPARRDSVRPPLEASLRAAVGDSSHSYGIRKANLDALLRVAGTAPTLGYLDNLLDSTSVAGAPLREPTRWAIVTRLLATRYPTASTRLAAQAARDSTSDGKRQAFIAAAAVPEAGVKRHYFAAYLGDRNLNEDWATASLGAFNELEQQEITLPFLKSALDTLPWLQHNRRIFFVGSWLDAFLSGQSSPQALATVQQFLRNRTSLGKDLRDKVLQALDELERTVAIRGEE